MISREPARTTRSRQPAKTELAVLVILALVVLVVRGAWFGDPNADIDEQLYSLIGLEMTRGAIPFVDLWDRKPIGLFAIFALAHAIGGPGPLSYQVLASLFVLAGAWMTYRLSLRLVDRLTGLGAGVLYVFLVSIYGGHSANAEVFFVPMMLWMATLVVEISHPQSVRRACIGMLIGGLALQVKYTVLPQCVFFGIWALWGQYRAGTSLPKLVRLAAVFGFLGILPTGLVAVGFALIGHFDEFFFANFVSFFDRIPSKAGRFRHDHLLLLLPIFGLLSAAVYAAFRLSPPTDRRTYYFFVLWLVATIATVMLPSTIYLYYFAALAPAVVLCSLPILDGRGAGKVFPLMLALASFGYFLSLPDRYEKARQHIESMDRLASAISPRVNGSSNCLYIFDGPTALYQMSGSCLPTRFIYPDHLNNAFERFSLGIPQIGEVARIIAARPPVIVTADETFTVQNEATRSLVWSTVKRDYEEIAREKLHGRTIRVWARRDRNID